MTDWKAIIRQRHSVRRYASEPLSAETLDVLRSGTREALALDARVSVAFELVSFDRIGRRSAVGVLPIFAGAPWYIIAHGPFAPGRMGEIGFRMEQIILVAASLGLGTCWIGGFFDPKVLAPLAECPPEDIIAISPVGYPSGGRLQSISYALTESVAYMRGKRKPLTEFCFAGEWERPVEPGAVSAETYEALEMARLAPSWSNIQPWYFLVLEGAVHAFADSRPKRMNDRPGKPYYELDTGIAMSHIALSQPGGRWQLPSEAPRPAGVPDWALHMGRYEG